MLELEKIKQLQTIEDFAAYLGYSSQKIAYILYSSDYQNKYRRFTIPKKNGEERIIFAPEDRLLTLQKRLAKKLQKCYKEIFSTFSGTHSIFIEKIRASVVHGFRNDLSIQSNAICHINRNLVLNIDLKDFFPSINFGRVRGFFIKNSFFNLNEKTATLIAQTVCYNNQLPQGSPTSPIIANLIATPMDVRILNLVKGKGIFYTRYADDLTFSTKLQKFPDNFLIVSESLEFALGKKLKNIIEKSGFIINLNKIRLQLKQSKQTVTGVVVNKKVNINREYYKLLRAQCHSLFTKGFYIENGIEILRTEYEKLRSLEGKLNFAFYTNNYCQNIYNKSLKNSNDKFSSFSRLEIKKKNVNNYIKGSSLAIKNLYLLYLYYKNFINIYNTTILCEGQTDVFYLKLAYKQLMLPKESKYNYVKLDGVLKKYSDFIGGTAKIKNFIKDYDNYIKKFNLPFNYPIIIIVDRDDAGKDVLTTYKNIYPSCNVLSQQTYYNGKNNLYLIMLPEFPEKTHVEIEYYLGEDIIENGINGYKLNLSNKETEIGKLGKDRFSKLVKKNKNKINFENFRLIFNQIENVEKNFFKK